MNFFTLFAHGENFDVDTYLKCAPLAFDKVWRRGDLRGRLEFIQDMHPTSGVEKFLGRGWELSTDEQDLIARDFLEANEESLRLLAQFPGVEVFILGLQCRIELTPGLRSFCMSASPSLMCLSARIGIVLTFYVDLDRKGLEEDA